MFEVYAAVWDADNALDRSQTFSTKSAALAHYNYLKDNPGLLNGSGFDLTITDLESGDEVLSSNISPL